MNYKKLGNTDLDVSTICLGTMTWGEQNTQEEGFQQMDYALDHGVNFWDTAEIYSIPMREETYGETERIIGNWFQKTKKRDKVVIATKVCGNTSNKYIRGGGYNFGKKKISEALEESLKRLKTDYIDLYQLHWPERNTNFFGKHGYEHDENDNDWTPFEEVLESLNQFIIQGKIRYIGLSNETAWGLSKFLELYKLKKLPKMMSVQNPYNLVNRTYEIGMSEISIREKCGLLVYYPLATGALSGKYRNGQMPKNSRQALFKGWERHLNPLAMQAYDKYFKLAQDFNLTMVQLAQSFVNSRPFVTSNIIGATTMEQLKENVESINIEFTDEMMDKVNEIHNNNPNPSP